MMKFIAAGCYAYLVVILIWPVSLWANDTTYYVDKLLPGSNSNNGTSTATPFLTVLKCIQTATLPGDTCLIKNGTYSNEALGNIVNNGGTSGHPITYKAYPGHTPVISWTDNTNSNNRILLNHSTATCTSSPPGWYVFEGLEISNGYNGIKINCAHDVVIRNNHIHDTWYPGILIPAGLNNTIDRNRVHHAGDFSGAVDPSTGQTHTHCFYLNGTGYVITNNLIYDCYLYGMQLKATTLGDPTSSPAPSQSYVSFSGLIANNTIAYTVTRGGLVLYNVGGTINNTTIENNIFYENVQLSGNTAPQGVHFYGGTGSRCPACVATIRNNLWFATGNMSTTFTMAGDLLSNPLPAGVTITNTTNANPLFINGPSTIPAAPNFHLSTSPIASPAIGIGFNLTGVVTTDLDGAARTAPYDDGAYVATASPSDTTPPATPTGLRVD